MNDRRASGRNRDDGAESPQSPQTEPTVVRLDEWLRRRHRQTEPGAGPDKPDPGPSAA